MKKGFVIGLTTGLTLAGLSVVLANSQIHALLNDQIKVTLNGQVQEFKDETTNETQYPITYKDRTYLPLRTVANLVGVDVDYDTNSNTAILKTKDFDGEINKKIPDGYIAVFHGGSSEITYETYIYKIDNGQASFGFEYVNVTNTTESWGSSKWNAKITKRGSVSWTDDVFEVAKENNAYSFVTLPNSDEIYTIEEFMSMFLMN